MSVGGSGSGSGWIRVGGSGSGAGSGSGCGFSTTLFTGNGPVLANGTPTGGGTTNSTGNPQSGTSADSYRLTQEDTSLVSSISVLANDTDANGDTLIVAVVNGSAAGVGHAVATAHGSVTVSADGRSFEGRVRIDTPGEADYYRHGGIMQFVLRSLMS